MAQSVADTDSMPTQKVAVYPGNRPSRKMAVSSWKRKGMMRGVVLFSVLLSHTVLAFMPPVAAYRSHPVVPTTTTTTTHDMSSGWSDFEAMDDPLLDEKIDNRDYAVENDSDEVKARVGASLQAPEIDDPPTDPIFVPAGSQLELDEETVLGVLQAAREELGTLFGYSAENRGVAITGGVDFVEME